MGSSDDAKVLDKCPRAMPCPLPGAQTWPVTCDFGGAEGIRTPDPLHAMQVRYQLRHRPVASGPRAGHNSTRLVHGPVADQFGRALVGAQSKSSLNQFLGLRCALPPLPDAPP